MRFSVEWLTHAEMRTPKKPCDSLCDDTIVVGDSNVSNHVASRRQRALGPPVSVPAVHFFERIASSSWFIFER